MRLQPWIDVDDAHVLIVASILTLLALLLLNPKKSRSILLSYHNWRKNASWFSASLVYEALKVEPTANRRVNLPGVVDAHLFNTQHFAGLDFEFDFEN